MANLSDIITPSNMLTADNTQTLSNKTIDAGTNTLTGTAASLTAGFATSATSATTAGTVTTAAQGNITSVGELTSLAVTGNISAGNISATTFTGTATQVAVTNTTNNANYYVPFISSWSTGNYELRNDTGIYYNPSSNQLNCTTLSASLLFISTGIDLADTDYVNFGTSDDAKFFYDGVNNTMELELEAAAASFVITDNGTHRVTFTKSNGDITTAGTVNAGSVSATGDVTAANFNTTSDARIKTNVSVIENAIDIVNQLEGVFFDKNGVADLGLIAQQVEAVLPRATKTLDDEMQTKTVNYGGLVGVLIEAIKSNKREIDELKSQISQLKS